ncbi:hypothetical protein HJFPF1_07635 [Paramyrothecium foliicola]|nr:hypothetical protein HJFPF1_07635 [Paramyrothecium foliicola]
MGFFTKKKKVTKSHGTDHPHKPSTFFSSSPPNVYTTAAYPAHKSSHHLPAAQAAPFPYSQQHQNHGRNHRHHQPAGYLPAPAPAPPPQQQPVIVNNHYYLGTQPQSPPRPQTQTPERQQQCQLGLGRFAGSMLNLAKDVVPAQLYEDGLSAWRGCNQFADSTTAICGDLSGRFDELMTMIDQEKLCGNESKLFAIQPQASLDNNLLAPSTSLVPVSNERGFGKSSNQTKQKPKIQPTSVAASVVTGNYFSKVEHYANSRLPNDLPRLAVYIPTWPLLCLAAQYSSRVYDPPKGAERDAHVSSDWRSGTKAMCIKSVPMDHMSTIVFAIRGSASFMDWAVNLHTEPTSPVGFLDDPGNLCHAGFLSVARKMIKPVAARLRQLLQDDPSRSCYSLMITGHSAGGAVAALLYSHMLAITKEARSELNILTGCFKRVHCVTFGAPPISLLPLTRPNRPELRKSLFLSIVNEGDPVVRADKAYVKSLLELLSNPPPAPASSPKESRDKKSSTPNPKKSKSKASLSSKPSKAMIKASSAASTKSAKPTWRVPPCTLSTAGRIVVLRSGDTRAKARDRKTVQERLAEGVVAVTCQEEQLREVIWGDPACHLMGLYAGRIEVLAVGAVSGR